MLRGIVSYEPSELVSPCALAPRWPSWRPLAEQTSACPLNPAFRQDPADAATVGGMVAAGLSGPGSRQRGGARLPAGRDPAQWQGRAADLGGQVMKNVAAMTLRA